MGGQLSISEIVARICENARFTPKEHQCFILFTREGLTLRQISERIKLSLAATHKHLTRARAKVLVLEQTADPEEIRWARLVLRLVRNRTTGRHKGAHHASPACPEWVPVRVAARLCGVSTQTVRHWIADPGNPIQAVWMETNGRRELCVPRDRLPLRPDLNSVPLHATLVTPDDLVHWRNVGEVRLP